MASTSVSSHLHRSRSSSSSSSPLSWLSASWSSVGAWKLVERDAADMTTVERVEEGEGYVHGCGRGRGMDRNEKVVAEREQGALRAGLLTRTEHAVHRPRRRVSYSYTHIKCPPTAQTAVQDGASCPHCTRGRPRRRGVLSLHTRPSKTARRALTAHAAVLDGAACSHCTHGRPR